jgi:hypothetical protein
LKRRGLLKDPIAGANPAQAFERENIMTDEQRELFRLRIRVLVLEDLVYQVLLATLPAKSQAKLAGNQHVLKSILNDANNRVEEAYFPKFSVHASEWDDLSEQAHDEIDEMRAALERSYEHIKNER